jgi:hypothetical protein
MAITIDHLNNYNRRYTTTILSQDCCEDCYVEQEKNEKEEMPVYLTSQRVRLHPTMTSFPLPDGATSRCGLLDDEEEVPAAYVPEIDEVGLPP